MVCDCGTPFFFFFFFFFVFIIYNKEEVLTLAVSLLTYKH